MGLNFLAAIMKGEGDKAGADYKAAGLERHAAAAKTAAVQTDAQLRENLNESLGNIQAVRAAQNTDSTSPTTAALMDRTAMIGDRARSIKVSNIMSQAQQDEMDAAFLRQSGDFAMQNAWLSAAGGALGTASKMKFA